MSMPPNTKWIPSTSHCSAIRLAPLVDLAVIAAHPKAFIGFSDATVIHMMCYRAGVVSFYGPHDSTYKSAGENVHAGVAALTGVQKMDEEGVKKLRAVSPYYMVRKGLPPFLLIHGDKDQQVDYEQSPRFCAALKEAGNKCELITVRDGAHGMGAWEQNPEQYGYKGKVVKWLLQRLR